MFFGFGITNTATAAAKPLPKQSPDRNLPNFGLTNNGLQGVVDGSIDTVTVNHFLPNGAVQPESVSMRTFCTSKAFERFGTSTERLEALVGPRQPGEIYRHGHGSNTVAVTGALLSSIRHAEAEQMDLPGSTIKLSAAEYLPAEVMTFGTDTLEVPAVRSMDFATDTLEVPAVASMDFPTDTLEVPAVRSMDFPTDTLEVASPDQPTQLDELDATI